MKRLRRLHFNIYSIIIGIIQFVIYLTTRYQDDSIYVALILFIFSLFVVARRLNDINLSSWWALLTLVPIVNFAGIALCFVDGTKGPNKYGEDPKKNERSRTRNNSFDSSGSNSNDQINNKIVEIKSLIKKNELLDESLSLGIITEDEYQQKKKEIADQKESLNKIETIKIQENKLHELWKSGILSQEEFKSKSNNLKNELTNLSKGLYDQSLISDPNIKYYYMSYYQEYGPYTVEEIKNHVRLKGINKNCLIRPVDESTYSDLRIQDL